MRVHAWLLMAGLSALCAPTSGLAEAAVGFDSIAGPLPKLVKNNGRPYLVVADIEVPADRMVVVEPGVVFLFRPFTGVHVQGRLEVRGTRAEPVVFTSENDQTYHKSTSLVANPYDWNGVYLHADALGSSFEHVKVCYSVYGLMSETRFIRVEPGEFYENGKSNLIVEGAEKVTTAQPFSYVLSTKDAMVDGVPIKILKDPAAPRRNTFRFAGLGLFVAGCAAGVVEAIVASRASEELSVLSNANTDTPEGFDNLRNGSSDQWEDADSRRTWNTVGSVAGFVVGAVGGAGFAWSFTF
jgi:hypothetical protein